MLKPDLNLSFECDIKVYNLDEDPDEVALKLDHEDLSDELVFKMEKEIKDFVHYELRSIAEYLNNEE